MPFDVPNAERFGADCSECHTPMNDEAPCCDACGYTFKGERPEQVGRVRIVEDAAIVVLVLVGRDSLRQ
jgi:hypothetical protein